MKKVSVVLPFYNGITLLEDALQSVINQTYSNIEIIVVNDGSTENVDFFLEKYAKNIKYVHRDMNGGCAAGRNTGIEHSTGDYIAFMDSDDIWLPTKIEKQVAIMEKTGAMWSNTGFYHWYPIKNKLVKINTCMNYGMVFPEIMIAFKICHPSVMIRREWFDQGKHYYYNEDYRYGQDTELFSKIAYLYPLALVNEPLVKMRMRGTNTNKRARLRIALKAQSYQDIKINKYNDWYVLPEKVVNLYKIYNFYDKLLPQEKVGFSNKTLEFTSKALWLFPFIFERMYRRY
jgi:glycosyltransferase involved in cell wall biosynthesis